MSAYFVYRDEMMPVLPASFLGGSVPGLEELCLVRVPFPELPNLLLSATHLVNLRLWSIPSAGYISPEAIVTCLSVLTRLETLDIGFELYPHTKNRRLPPPTRTLLPVLTRLRFEGFGVYLENFVARIDAPLLNELRITFFHQLISDTLQLAQFVSHTPKFKTHNEACVVVHKEDISVILPQTFHGALQLGSLFEYFEESNQHLSYLLQVCSSSLPQDLFPAVEQLLILYECDIMWDDEHETENSQWLELLHPFIAVKDLYLSEIAMRHIAPFLQELVGESVTEEPVLRSGTFKVAIEQFVAARELAGHPIVVSHWERRQFEDD
jgi:hypothetical protein